MLVARPFEDTVRFRKAVSSLIAGLGSKPSAHL
jgi:hypothetical protein